MATPSGTAIAGDRRPWRLRAVVEAPLFSHAVTTVIIVNAIALGLETSPQVMTLESWSMGIVRPVMDVYPYAWAFFVPFIVLTSFTVLNLFIALIVNSMQALQKKERAAARLDFELAHDERERLQASIDALAEELKSLRSGLQGS